MKRIAWILGLALVLCGPALAQDLRGSFPDTGSAPVPRGPDGKPIPVPEQTPEQREEVRKQDERRAELRRAEEARQAEEARRATEEHLAAERLAEEKRHHDSVMTAVWVGLAIAGIFVASRLFKRT